MPQWLRLIHSTIFRVSVALCAGTTVLLVLLNTTASFAAFISLPSGIFGIVWGTLRLIYLYTEPNNSRTKALTEGDVAYVVAAVVLSMLLISISAGVYLTVIRQVGSLHALAGSISILATLSFLVVIIPNRIPKDTKNMALLMCIVVVILVLFF